MVHKHFRVVALVILSLIVAGVASGCSLGRGKPQVGSSFSVAVGGQPGSQAWNDQRITYEGTISNMGTSPIVGWSYKLSVAPLIAGRITGSKQETDPGPGTAGVYPDLDPGKSVTIKGYLDFQADGLTKQVISDAEPLVVVIITDGAGNEIARLGGKAK